MAGIVKNLVLYVSLCCVVGLSCPTAAAAQEDFNRNLALCVGINGYTRMGQLRYCAQDAYAILERLEDSGNFRRVKLLSDIDENGNAAPVTMLPTANNILATLRQLSSLVPESGSLLFFFSGHGVERDGTNYLVPVDGDETSGISVDEIKQIMTKSRAGNKLIILDACRSGLGAKGLAGVRGSLEEDNLAILVSCGADQFSYEVEQSQRSLFTLVLEEALTGKADADEDGAITGGELHRYLDRGMGDFCLDNDILVTQVPEINAAGRDAAFLTLNPEFRAKKERERVEELARKQKEAQEALRLEREQAEFRRIQQEREIREEVERKLAETRRREEEEARIRHEQESRREDSLYASATDKYGCEAYLSVYPNGRYSSEVRTRLQQLSFDVTGRWFIGLYGSRNNLEVSYDVMITNENGRYVWRPISSSFRTHGGFRASPSNYLDTDYLQGCWYQNGIVHIYFSDESEVCDFHPVGNGYEHRHQGSAGKMVIRKK